MRIKIFFVNKTIHSQNVTQEFDGFTHIGTKNNELKKT